MKWLIPVLVLLFVIGKIAEALRLARGSAYEDIEFLRAAIHDVESRAKALPAEIAATVSQMLAPALLELESCQSRIEQSTAEERKAMRPRLKAAMQKVAEARALVDKHTQDAEDDAD